MTILDKTLIITPRDDKSNIVVPFTLPGDAERMIIACRFEPKVIEDKALARQAALANIGRYVPRYQLPLYQKEQADSVNLVNHLTLSLDCGEEYLGCAHRHAPEQTHEISESFSSPGFRRFRPRAGEYQAVINVHSVTSKEVRYHITVEAAIKEEGHD